MFKKLAIVACLAVLAACSDSGGGSSDGNNNQTGTETPGTNPAPTPPAVQPPATQPPATQPPVAPPPTNTGGSANPSGGTSGAWFGTTSFGEGVVIIDNTNRIYALSNAGSDYEAIHGTVGGSLERFFHRDSDNPAHGDSFTLVGDPALQADGVTGEVVNYNLSVTNDGQQLNNAGGPGDFSLTFGTANDIAAIDAAGIAGNWQALTSFCPSGCDLALNLTFNGTAVNGSTFFGQSVPLNGQLAAAADSNLYMTIAFEWNGQNRSGVIYRDRTNSDRLILNTIGQDGENGNRTFTAILSRN